MYYTTFEKLFDSLLDNDSTSTRYQNFSTTFVPSKFAAEVKDDKAIIALSVLGHDPKSIEINCYEDKIEVKAKKGEEKSPFYELVANIDERITLGKDLDGRNAKAEIKNGILLITVERKEESKPKKINIKLS